MSVCTHSLYSTEQDHSIRAHSVALQVQKQTSDNFATAIAEKITYIMHHATAHANDPTGYVQRDYYVSICKQCHSPEIVEDSILCAKQNAFYTN